MSKHTPGPWKVCFTHFSKVLASNGALIATCNRLDSLTGLQANARLVASAPELFGIVARLAAIGEGLANGNSAAENEACHLAGLALAVIAKATGEQA